VIMNMKNQPMTRKQALAFFKVSENDQKNAAILDRRIAEVKQYYTSTIKDELDTLGNRPRETLGILGDCEIVQALSLTQEINDTVAYKKLDGKQEGDLSVVVPDGVRLSPGWIKITARLKVRCTPRSGLGWTGYAGFVQRIDDYTRTTYVPKAQNGSSYLKSQSVRSDWMCRDGGQGCLAPFYDEGSFFKIDSEYTGNGCVLFDDPGVRHTMGAAWPDPGIDQAIRFTTWFIIANESRDQWLVLHVVRWRADFKLFRTKAGGVVTEGGVEYLGRAGYSNYATLPLVRNDPLGPDVLGQEKLPHVDIGNAEAVAGELGGWTTPPPTPTARPNPRTPTWALNNK